jgi:hypothetical protein
MSDHFTETSSQGDAIISNTLYVLACSTLGAIFSLAATWIFVAHSMQPMVA